MKIFSRSILHATALSIGLIIASSALSGCSTLLESGMKKIEESEARKTLTVTRIIDGDTLAVEPTEEFPATNDSEKNPEHVIRILGINAPELNKKSQDPAECGAKEATKALGEYAPVGSDVKITYDKNSDKTDRYGRTLAYLSSDSYNDIGSTMVYEGYAVPYYPKSAYEPKRYTNYVSDAESAGSYKKGNYASCKNFGKEYR